MNAELLQNAVTVTDPTFTSWAGALLGLTLNPTLTIARPVDRALWIVCSNELTTVCFRLIGNPELRTVKFLLSVEGPDQDALMTKWLAVCDQPEVVTAFTELFFRISPVPKGQLQ